MAKGWVREVLRVDSDCVGTLRRFRQAFWKGTWAADGR